MKRRAGLVSNSSSSSYIIAIKRGLKSEECPTCGHKNPDLLDTLSSSDHEETYVEVKGGDLLSQLVEDINDTKRMIHNCGNAPTLWMLEDLKKGQEILEEVETIDKNNWIIAMIEISNHDERSRELFDSLRKTENMKIIRDWD
jgi:hypothetical protein